MAKTATQVDRMSGIESRFEEVGGRGTSKVLFAKMPVLIVPPPSLSGCRSLASLNLKHLSNLLSQRGSVHFHLNDGSWIGLGLYA